ncbi:recombinase family protein [Anaerotruncus rubiinfantis]|uniref:recombinase family protein n=1 Tax=Anaerotruncus rubiinfantis TaxID=1720200 RepID=UPI0034A466A9
MLLRLAAYCRVSTELGEQLESLENQKSFFEEFARRHHYDLVEIYADEGISGKQIHNREAFLRMLSDAGQHLFDMVVVKDISRFSRNTVDFLNAVRQLKALRIEVQFLSNNQTVLGNSEFILTIFSALAQEESANLSKRVKFGKRVNAKKGRVPNVVYGYDQKDTFTLRVNEPEAQIVREIFTLYVQDGWGVRKIAQHLNESGVPSKRGYGWTPKTIRRMLENPLYIGILENNKSETVDFLTGMQVKLPPEEHFFHDRPELAIVPRELYDRAQREIAARRKPEDCEGKLAARHSARRLFSTLIRCGVCGYAFTRVQYTYQNTYVKWRCSGKNQYGAKFCKNNLTIDEADLTGALDQYLASRIADRGAFAARVAAACRGNAPPDAEKARQKRLERIARQKQRYRTLYANELLTLEELKEKLAALGAREAELSDQQQSQPITSGHVLEELRLSHWTNAELRELVETIEARPDGRVVIRFRTLAPAGLPAAKPRAAVGRAP